MAMEELQASLNLCEEKYIRLFRAHDKLQKLNQCLEEKLLNLAESHHEESSHFSSQVDELTQSLVEARIYIHQLEDENDRYRNDINAVVQLLQCKPSSFVSPKIGMLPEDLQRKVLGQKNGRKEKKIIKVQVPSTLPQMDIMYAVDNGRVKRTEEKTDVVSAAIIATILKEREKERDENKSSRCHCNGLRRIIRLPMHSVETQTLPSCTISYSGFTCPEYSVIPIEEQNDEQKLEKSPTVAKPLSNYQILSNLTTCPSPATTTTTRALRPNSLKLSSNSTKKLTLTSDSSSNSNNNNESHWSTTVLVQHPPKQRIDPMSMYLSSKSNGEMRSKSHSVTSTPTTPMSSSLDMDSDESQPLMGQGQGQGQGHPLTASTKYPSSQSRQQYYRAQKRSFWTRSSSTTSTETEI